MNLYDSKTGKVYTNTGTLMFTWDPISKEISIDSLKIIDNTKEIINPTYLFYYQQ